MKVWIFSKRFLMPFSEFRPQVWFSKLSTLCLHFAHMRFGKPLSSFNVIYPTCRALILDASLSWLAFFYQTMLLYGGYKPQRIHKCSKLMLFSLTGSYYLNFVRAHAPSASVCTRHSLCAGYQASNTSTADTLLLRITDSFRGADCT